MTGSLLDGDPARIGPYLLHARLGGGGMGRVFLGRSPGGHTVAVKVVRPELAQDVDFRRRFATEVAAARKVGGFYTAQVVDADTDADPPWLATAYIPGPTLDRAVADQGPLPTESVAVLGAGLAEGLMAVHAQKLVHRDLKPGNVILAEDGPRLIDFGIARDADSPTYTAAQPVIGTIGFMSPEQACGSEVAPPSDVFALGCVLAFAATGRNPFGQGPIHAVIFRVVHEEPDLTGLPAPLADLVKACLAKEPAARPGLDQILARLTLAVDAPASARPAQRWLPDALTEIITRRTLAPTRVETEQGRPRERNAAEPKKQRRQATDSGTTEAELVIGNLSTHPMEVVVDGTVLGTVQRAATRAFLIAPGHRSLLVRAGHHGMARRIVAKAATTKMAFDIPQRGQAAPAPAHTVVFTGSRLPGAFTMALVWSVLIWFVCGVAGVAVFATGDAHPSVDGAEALFAVAVAGLAVGALVGLPSYFSSSPPRLTLSRRGVMIPGHERMVMWDRLGQVSVIGHGPDAALVFTRRAATGPGSMVARCSAKSIGAGRAQSLDRLRAALRWFAGDIWVEQPTAP